MVPAPAEPPPHDPRRMGVALVRGHLAVAVGVATSGNTSASEVPVGGDGRSVRRRW
jgi:hypothetical protein